MFITINLAVGGAADVNLDHVVLAMERDGVHTLTMVNGQELTGTINGPTVFDFGEVGTIVPAAPGFNRIIIWDAATDHVSVDQEPVVAWRVTKYGAEPISMFDSGWAGVAGDSTGVVAPSGEVHHIDGISDSVDAFVRQYCELARADQTGTG